MTEVSKRALYWPPRVWSIVLIAFLCTFALDMFGLGQGFWKTLVALKMHLIPSFVVIAALFLWNWLRHEELRRREGARHKSGA